jgi:RNA-binding motif X-linked protein 2
MNALTQIRQTQRASKKEIELGLLDSSWHDRFKHSAYIYVGGLPFELTEGDVLAVCSQYGEIVDVNLVKDATTKKSRGCAFVAYEDQRSTVLAVDNLSGSQVGGRTIRVEHVDNYRKKKEELDGAAVDVDGHIDDQAHSKEEEDNEQEHKGTDVESYRQEMAPDTGGTAEAGTLKPMPSWRDLVARRDRRLEEEKESRHGGRKRKHKHGQGQRRKERPY